jgi:hypothetical protein
MRARLGKWPRAPDTNLTFFGFRVLKNVAIVSDIGAYFSSAGVGGTKRSASAASDSSPIHSRYKPPSAEHTATVATPRDQHQQSSYNETQLRREFLDPFLEALGWYVDNRQEGKGRYFSDAVRRKQNTGC